MTNEATPAKKDRKSRFITPGRFLKELETKIDRHQIKPDDQVSKLVEAIEREIIEEATGRSS